MNTNTDKKDDRANISGLVNPPAAIESCVAVNSGLTGFKTLISVNGQRTGDG